jgi:hypothetical protein
MLLNYLNELPYKFARFVQSTPITLTILRPVRPLLIRVYQSLQRFVNERDVRRRARAEGMTSPEQLAQFFSRLHAVDPGLPMIRLGGDGDGGYVVPDDLDGLAACFSPGVSDVADFELALAERGVPSFMADASVEAAPSAHPLLDFEPTFVGPEDAPGWTTMESWMSRKGPAPEAGDLLLQMDIEGAEWDVLASLDRATLLRFRMIVLELHDMQQVFLRSGLDTVQTVLTKLIADFEMVHLHANNNMQPVRLQGYEVPPVLEMTLLRKGRVREATPVSTLPHPLDARCNVWVPDLVLPTYWYA